MKTIAVKTKEGWYIRELPGFEDIQDDTIEVDVELSTTEYRKRDYKELRGIAIMERYLEKEARSDPIQPNSNARETFRKVYGYEEISGMEDVLRILRGVHV